MTRLAGSKHARRRDEPVEIAPSSPAHTDSLLAGFYPQSMENRIELGGLLIHLIEQCRHQVSPGIVLGLNARLGTETMVSRREAEALALVFCEIVSNAWRHSHPAGGPVEVTAECELGRKGEIILEIGDDGTGLSPDFAEWRDAGLGMASVRAKLQDIGAALNLTSDDLGLRFQIILHPAGPPHPARGNFVWL